MVLVSSESSPMEDDLTIVKKVPEAIPLPIIVTTTPSSTTTSSENSGNGGGASTTISRSENADVTSSASPGQTIITASTKSNVAPTCLLADRYLLIPPSESSTLNTCIDVKTGQKYVCRIVERRQGCLLEAHHRVDGCPRINPLERVVLGRHKAYLVFPPSFGDLHGYVRFKRKLREPEARRLFAQVAQAVHSCHSSGLVLRDLKLRKFVFADPEKTELKLESLEDAVVLEDEADDILADKRGCPAYVSPEILRSNAKYSGRAADIWSLGVILYTMLVGRYPFHDTEHMSLFWKISRGQYVMPECVPPGGRCLIRSMLRREPSERLTAEDILHHPWLRPATQPDRLMVSHPPLSPPSYHHRSSSSSCCQLPSNMDQVVPSFVQNQESQTSQKNGRV